ncbi:MAG: hemerythrin family protein [Gammaproteobacteria bacterium]|nr:hemerythrin family protein [Gammaproteobacteria bacterium]
MPVVLPFEAIEWSDDMATGVATIDRQHRFLVDTLCDANRRLLASRENALPGQIVRDLLAYAVLHFVTEEELMKRVGYDLACSAVAGAHVAQHREFSRRIVAVCDRLREGRDVSRLDVLEYLNDWLRNHVLDISGLS